MRPRATLSNLCTRPLTHQLKKMKTGTTTRRGLKPESGGRRWSGSRGLSERTRRPAAPAAPALSPGVTPCVIYLSMCIYLYLCIYPSIYLCLSIYLSIYHPYIHKDRERGRKGEREGFQDGRVAPARKQPQRFHLVPSFEFTGEPRS